MKYFYTSLITLMLAALISCSQNEEAASLPSSPLVALMTPSLVSSIASAEAAVQTALSKADYTEQTRSVLVALSEQLALLSDAIAAISANKANAAHVEQLAISAGRIHQLRGLIEADIIALKETNAAAAIRLGVVNELAELCELTAEDISHTLRPRAF